MLRTYLDYSVLDGARNIPIFLTVGISEHATENSIRYYYIIRYYYVNTIDDKLYLGRYIGYRLIP